MGKGKHRVPDNWVDVAKMGTLVGTSRFAPLRVPLDETYLPQLETKRDQIWTPRDFLALQRDQKYNVKLLIDLTNTSKYYNGDKELKNSGVRYLKLPIEGFYGPPDAKEVKKFVALVDDFVAKTPEGTIAVHCTHGLNRTGYLVVTYLVQRLAYSVTDALAAFKAARPPGLIKHMYVEDLYKRWGAGEKVQLPELPAWASAKYSARAKGSAGKAPAKGSAGKAPAKGSAGKAPAKGSAGKVPVMGSEEPKAPAKRKKRKKRSKTVTKLPSGDGDGRAATEGEELQASAE
ncbi:unnamed protein product [Hyaloperonospora brassicae]|uniref:Tyrosine specific protein phosphatases domain-containing protein n=1 Tax=Hyaloperonospora brassicae TaxID=162125 RepID=A0AAV0UZ89_HYABA|nr:unnamed protein product [Hyaloperonospora brassicae]